MCKNPAPKCRIFACIFFVHATWHTGRDSNPQPSEPESDALSIEPPVQIRLCKKLYHIFYYLASLYFLFSRNFCTFVNDGLNQIGIRIVSSLMRVYFLVTAISLAILVVFVSASLAMLSRLERDGNVLCFPFSAYRRSHGSSTHTSERIKPQK